MPWFLKNFINIREIGEQAVLSAEEVGNQQAEVERQAEIESLTPKEVFDVYVLFYVIYCIVY